MWTSFGQTRLLHLLYSQSFLSGRSRLVNLFWSVFHFHCFLLICSPLFLFLFSSPLHCNLTSWLTFCLQLLLSHCIRFSSVFLQFFFIFVLFWFVHCIFSVKFRYEEYIWLGVDEDHHHLAWDCFSLMNTRVYKKGMERLTLAWIWVFYLNSAGPQPGSGLWIVFVYLYIYVFFMDFVLL